MRVVIVLRQDCAPLVEANLARLTKIITVISKNPLNPKFNHYAFETLALFVR
jgi:exportin-2 (importin alpha re-exporter)